MNCFTNERDFPPDQLPDFQFPFDFVSLKFILNEFHGESVEKEISADLCYNEKKKQISNHVQNIFNCNSICVHV